MPFKAADAHKHNKGLSRKEARKWVSIANSSLNACVKKGGSDETCAPKAIITANGVIKRDREKEANMKTTEITKKMGSKNYPASSFLVVGDSEKPSTWSLPVKTSEGKPDHDLMGGAFAALHGGYRENKYEGPDKDKAISKLKALYKAENLDTPAETYAGEELPNLAEYYGDDVYTPYVPSTITSFDQLDMMQATEEMSRELRGLTDMYTQMVQNIVYWFEGDKVAQLRMVSAEFADRIDAVLNGEDPEVTESVAEKFSESEAGEAILLEETDSKDVLHLNVAIIKPGWGNKVDNHYYSAEMLQKCAESFNGAKMYETDHRQEEKSTRTWVSTITEIKGFTDDGAPIARVAVHDPGFAERVRNLNAAGLINRLECSILASGSAEAGFELAGRKGKKVTAITEVDSVDWVTKAGAGGRALELAENEKKEGDPMKETPETAAQATEQPEQVVETVNTVPVKVNENETPEMRGSEEETPTTEPVQPAQTDTPAPLAAEAVRSLLSTSKLPKAAQERLAVSEYADQAALEKAIESEKAYLADLLEAGQVFGMGASDKGAANTNKAETEKAIREAAERVNKKYFGG